ncbi:tRNA (N6-threonylcarbamoyladenosine(37)-N6)-methyltransferase TrmO [Desulfitobacterium chlororespirans]|uniref:tRNA-Thr(GGU) m(6)t(6)A37 methyltransferase TsaA n=1 Tax=Desulfitobacterium chlororespirans DSM 11544 TaxID=1121395 RepID=A0A1M7TGN3_9FIRM|nr:tRNA (N6-threonylcarbamoyladenosine(37)-N6)-methyltransferase TrmO [Desulfitobacterium chlororespirans]SHN69870.1 tRNA-Thr(GGU) m(6)t(6)A37 methyltransferase TsaA [Desulfitobacterium chlororespirans DSM 11544]
MEILMKPIGYIRSPYKEKGDAPRQSTLSGETMAVIEVLEEYQEGIADIQAGGYGAILFYFHKSPGYKLTTLSRRNNQVMGVFSTRSPNRPNGIGLSIVRFRKREGNRLFFEGVDMLDNTPVLDIKPYIDLTTGQLNETGFSDKGI